MIKRQQGFTLVELLVAMAIFSFMSIILSAGIARLFQIYQAGIAIRASQQSAANVSQAFTRDVQSAQVVAEDANGNPMAGAYQNYFNAICVLNPVNTTSTSQTLEGSIYFAWSATGSYTPNDQIGVYKETGIQIVVPIAPPATLPTQSSLNGHCKYPTSLTNAQLISSNDTSAIVFNASQLNKNGVIVMKLLLSMAANTDLPNVNAAATTNSGGGFCNDGPATQYCSITNLYVSAETRGGVQ